MSNIDIRVEATKKNVRLWQIAEVLGISDANFSRKLRRELPEGEREKVFAIIANIAEEAANAK